MDLEKPLKFIGFCGGISMCAFLRAASKTRKSLPKSNENQAKKQRKTNTRATHQNNIKKPSKNPPKWLPRGGVEGSWGLLAAGSAPRASQNQLRRLSGPQKNGWRAPGGGQEEIWRSVPSPLKTPPPPGGGGRVLRPSVLEHFSLKSLLAPRRGAKIEGPGFQGATLGVGGRS